MNSELSLRVVVVDDEPLARERSRRMLHKIGDVDIVREFGNAREALSYIESDPPDVVMLDINMPELDGLRLIEALDDPPAIILATAHEHHAVRAFELEVVDYLLKPFSTERLAKALARVRRQLGVDPLLPKRDDRTTSESSQLPRIPADTGRGIDLIASDNLSGAVLEESVVFLLRDDGDRLCFAGTLQELEELLPAETFLRASRSAIVSLPAVLRYEPVNQGGLVLDLKGKHRVQVSRRRARFFRARLPGA